MGNKLLILTWLLTILSLCATVMNIHKKRTCFLIWICSNSMWAIIDFKKDIPAQGWLFVIYTGLAAWGFYSWGKRKAA